MRLGPFVSQKLQLWNHVSYIKSTFSLAMAFDYQYIIHHYYLYINHYSWILAFMHNLLPCLNEKKNAVRYQKFMAIESRFEFQDPNTTWDIQAKVIQRHYLNDLLAILTSILFFCKVSKKYIFLKNYRSKTIKSIFFSW